MLDGYEFESSVPLLTESCNPFISERLVVICELYWLMKNGDRNIKNISGI